MSIDNSVMARGPRHYGDGDVLLHECTDDCRRQCAGCGKMLCNESDDNQKLVIEGESDDWCQDCIELLNYNPS